MKYLKIDNDKGYFLKKSEEGDTFIEIDKITKEDLMSLLNSAISDEFEMDPFSEANMDNKAHQIIYKNISEKLLNLTEEKNKFKDEVEALYKEALDKYGNIN